MRTIRYAVDSLHWYRIWFMLRLSRKGTDEEETTQATDQDTRQDTCVT